MPCSALPVPPNIETAVALIVNISKPLPARCAGRVLNLRPESITHPLSCLSFSVTHSPSIPYRLIIPTLRAGSKAVAEALTGGRLTRLGQGQQPTPRTSFQCQRAETQTN